PPRRAALARRGIKAPCTSFRSLIAESPPPGSLRRTRFHRAPTAQKHCRQRALPAPGSLVSSLPESHHQPPAQRILARAYRCIRVPLSSSVSRALSARSHRRTEVVLSPPDGPLL